MPPDRYSVQDCVKTQLRAQGSDLFGMPFAVTQEVGREVHIDVAPNPRQLATHPDSVQIFADAFENVLASSE